MPELTVAFLLFPKVTQLDLTGPAQVFSRLGNVRIELVAKTLEPVQTDAGFALVPTATFSDVDRADILCVPGGFGIVEAMEDEATLDWVRGIAAESTWITSVCTGSLLLAAAGLLDECRAACHWASRDQLKLFGALPVAERVVFHANRVTGGGVTAGIDFALALTAKIRGDDHAKLVQLSLEYDPAPPFDCGTPEKADVRILGQLNELAGERMAERAKRVEAIAEKFRRDQFDRLSERSS